MSLTNTLAPSTNFMNKVFLYFYLRRLLSVYTSKSGCGSNPKLKLVSFYGISNVSLDLHFLLSLYPYVREK